MEKDIFEVAFRYELDQIRGTAEIEPVLQKEKPVCLVRKLRLINTDLTDEQADILDVPGEIVIKPIPGPDTDALHWVDTTAEEESELIDLIGEAIVRHVL